MDGWIVRAEGEKQLVQSMSSCWTAGIKNPVGNYQREKLRAGPVFCDKKFRTQLGPFPCLEWRCGCVFFPTRKKVLHSN